MYVCQELKIFFSNIMCGEIHFSLYIVATIIIGQLYYKFAKKNNTTAVRMPDVFRYNGIQLSASKLPRDSGVSESMDTSDCCCFSSLDLSKYEFFEI